MIKTVTVINSLGDKLTMELKRPELSGFFIKSISGLTPGSATINVTDINSSDGSVFNSSRIGKRNIVITFGYLPRQGENVEDLRLLSYNYFQLKKKLTLIIETNNRTCIIDGYVESYEATIFSTSSAYSLGQVSIICPNPYFRDSDSSKFYLYGIEPMLTFPYSNAVATTEKDNYNTIFSSYNRRSAHSFTYLGDADTGIVIDIFIDDLITGFEILDNENNVIMSIDDTILNKLITKAVSAGTITGANTLQAKDEIVISTITGQKSASLVRAGKSVNIINALGRDVTWLTISKGLNSFAFRTTSEEMMDNINIVLFCDTLYEGI